MTTPDTARVSTPDAQRHRKLVELAELHAIDLCMGDSGGLGLRLREQMWLAVWPSIRDRSASATVLHWLGRITDRTPDAFWRFTAPGLSDDGLDEILAASGVKS